MKLYVCYGTFKFAPRPGGHPCGNAFHALKDAGHDPEVVLSYGWGVLPDVFNRTKGREEVKRLTGNHWVPALVTDDGSVVQGSDKIVAWAREHPAGATAATAPPPGQAAGTPEAPTGPTTGSE
jgi:glutathione S-transferase-like protein